MNKFDQWRINPKGRTDYVKMIFEAKLEIQKLLPKLEFRKKKLYVPNKKFIEENKLLVERMRGEVISSHQLKEEKRRANVDKEISRLKFKISGLEEIVLQNRLYQKKRLEQRASTFNSSSLCFHNFQVEAFDLSQIKSFPVNVTLTDTKNIPPLTSFQKRIYLPVSPENYITARSLGALKEGRYLFVHNEPKKIKHFVQFLPVAFRPDGHPPLDVQLSPKSTWGTALVDLFVRQDWEIIKNQIFLQHNKRCQLCGSRKVSDIIKYHEKKYGTNIQELWSYHILDGRMPIQRLEGFLCLCADCHMMFHPDITNFKGSGEHFSKRLAYYNGWDETQISENIDFVFKTHTERSKLSWDLDISLVVNFMDTVGIKKKHADNLPTIYGLKYHIAGQKTDVFYETQ